jgi:hypothetical protein
MEPDADHGDLRAQEARLLHVDSSDHSCPHRRHCRLVPWLPLPVPRTMSFGTSAERHCGHA